MFRNQYDNDITVFSPQGRLHQIEYAMEAVKQGSAAVGLRSKTFSVLLALKRSQSELASYQNKIIKIDKHMGVAVAGLISDANILSSFMRTEAMKSKMLFNRPLPTLRIVTKLSDKAQVNTQKYGFRPYGVGLLVAGYDETGPHLFECAPSGNFFDYVAISIGARSQSAKTYLEKHYQSFENSTMDELILHGLRSLRETLQSDKELNLNNCSIAVVGEGVAFHEVEGEQLQRFLDLLAQSDASNAPATSGAPADGPTPMDTEKNGVSKYLVIQKYTLFKPYLMGFECEIPNACLKPLTRFLQTFGKFGDQITLEPLPLINIFKHNTTNNETIEKCTMKLNEEVDRLIIEFQCKFGIIKTHKLHFQECESVQAVYLKQGCKNNFSVSPKLCQDWLGHFQLSLEEVTLHFNQNDVIFKSFTECMNDNDEVKRSLVTELLVDLIDFDSYNVNEPTKITIRLKDFKSILLFGETMSQTVFVYFDGPGSPVTFSCSQPDLFLSDFVVATVNENDINAFSEASSNASQSQQAHSMNSNLNLIQKSTSLGMETNHLPKLLKSNDYKPYLSASTESLPKKIQSNLKNLKSSPLQSSPDQSNSLEITPDNLPKNILTENMKRLMSGRGKSFFDRSTFDFDEQPRKIYNFSQPTEDSPSKSANLEDVFIDEVEDHPSNSQDCTTLVNSEATKSMKKNRKTAPFNANETDSQNGNFQTNLACMRSNEHTQNGIGELYATDDTKEIHVSENDISNFSSLKKKIINNVVYEVSNTSFEEVPSSQIAYYRSLFNSSFTVCNNADSFPTKINKANESTEEEIQSTPPVKKVILHFGGVHGRKKEQIPPEVLLKLQEKDLKWVNEYKEKNFLFLNRKKECALDSATFSLTTDLINLNIEYYTVWNYRRKIFINDFKTMSVASKDEVCSGELKFVENCLKINPKSYWVWNQRRWILENMPNPTWAREIYLVDGFLKADARNFHGWNYRRYVISQSNLRTDVEEFDFTTKKIYENFSNHSAWHSRSVLLPKIFKNRNDLQDAIDYLKDLEIVRNAVYTDPDDQSSWLYQKFLLGTCN
ncbi:hypothetical protein HDU92_003224 [Lobulomyces angularis]|nr:hypothetical protein HDU92_003224 [Lobulomyces angularis]